MAGSRLIDDINAARPRPGHLAFWWLGQLGFAVKLGEQVVYLDPYLSEAASRLVRPVVAPAEVTNADVIAGSHDHGDHIDRRVWPTLATASERATFVVPELILRRGLAADLGIAADRFAGLDAGRTVTIGGLRITGVAAAHELLDVDEATGLHPYLGYAIEGNGCRIYHAGDTCNYEGLLTRLEDLGSLDVMFVPINGRDAKRLAGGCIGNMTYQEAVDLAGAVRPRLAVPAHFEMFANNREDPRSFIEYAAVKYPQLHTMIPQHGVRVEL